VFYNFSLFFSFENLGFKLQPKLARLLTRARSRHLTKFNKIKISNKKFVLTTAVIHHV